MPCDFDRIDALLDGSLEEAARQSVLTHIEACPTCRAYFEAMQTLECDAAPSADFAQRVMEQVRTTPQQKKRAASYRRVLAGLAACAVLVLGLRLLPLGGNGDELPVNGRSVGDIASDLPLTIYPIEDDALCAKVRLWLQQQEMAPLYGEGLREAYDLTAEDVAALMGAVPELQLPQQMLQLELKSAK